MMEALTPAGRRLVVIGAFASIALFFSLLYALIAGGPGHDEILTRINQLEHNQRVVVCLLQFEEVFRTPEQVAACQVPPPPAPPPD